MQLSWEDSDGLEDFGSKQSFTPEGYLICRDVPIARVGSQIYRADEIPVTPSRDGFVRIMREPEEVFNPDTLASFERKPIVNDHPPDLLGPASWRQYTIGAASNIRQGTGAEEGRMIGDLTIFDPACIDMIRSKRKLQISLGYDAQYEEVEPGLGRQRNIIGNHIAIVQSGRCGSQCSIGDSAPMPIAIDRRTTLQRLRDAFATKDAAAFDMAMADMGAPPPSTPPLPDGSSPGSTDPSGGQGRIIVNVHGGAKPAAGAVDGGGAPPPGAPPGAAPPAAAPPAAGNDPMTAMLGAIQALTQQVSQLGQMIQSALGEEEGEEGGDPNQPDDEEFQTASQNGPDPDIGAEGEQDIPPKPQAKAGSTDKGDLTTAETAPKVDGAMGKHPPGTTGDEGGDLTQAVETKKVGEPLGTDPIKKASNTKDAKPGPTKKTVTKDSTPLAEDFTNALSIAEVLVPGIGLPTFDAAVPYATTQDTICSLQRSALGTFAKTRPGKDVVKTLTNGGTFDAATTECDKLSVVFYGAGEIMRRSRNQRMPTAKTKDSASLAKGIPTLAEMNARAAEVWSQHRTNA